MIHTSVRRSFKVDKSHTYVVITNDIEIAPGTFIVLSEDPLISKSDVTFRSHIGPVCSLNTYYTVRTITREVRLLATDELIGIKVIYLYFLESIFGI
jgi:hypothetical protein